jgi:hypothetical protein
MEFSSYCVSKQGDWSLALSYCASKRETAAFWSVEEGVDPQSLINMLMTFRDLSVHPMLIPCIMFAKILEQALQRRSSLKRRIQSLETALQDVSKKIAQSSREKTPQQEQDADDGAEDVGLLLVQLQSCRNEQGSREGRYHFWESYHRALTSGLDLTAVTEPNADFAAAETNLRQWKNIVWEKLQSLQARDKDHVNRVNIVAEMVRHNIADNRG